MSCSPQGDPASAVSLSKLPEGRAEESGKQPEDAEEVIESCYVANQKAKQVQ